jgi:hypothetical protein
VSALRGVAAGALGLTALEAFVSSPSAGSNAGTLFTLATGVVRRLFDPTVPLIPDRRTK